MRSGDLLYGRHSRQQKAEIFSEILCRAGKAAGKTGSALSGDQGYGRIVQAVCGVRIGEKAEGSGSGCCGWRNGFDERWNEPAESECDGGSSTKHSAGYRARSRNPERMFGLLGNRADILLAV